MHRDVDELIKIENKKQYRRNIIWLIFLFSFLFLSISAIAFGYYLNQINQIKKQKQEELTAIAAAKVSEIDAWRNERLGDGKIIQQNLLFAQTVQSYLNDPTDDALKRSITDYLTSVRSVYSYTTFFLLDPQGKILLSDTTHPEELGDEDITSASQTAQSGQIHFSDLIRSSDTNTIHIDLMIPIQIISSKTIAVVALRIDPYFYLYPLIQSWPMPSDSAESLLVRKEGTEVLFLNSLRFKTDTALKLKFPLSSQNLPAALAVQGKTGPIEGVDYRGIKVLSVANPIPDTNWYLVTKVDQSEVYAAIYRASWLVGIALGCLLLCTLTIAFVLIRRQDQKMVNLLLREELEKQELNQKFKILFEKGNDIIFVFDESGRIIEANELAVATYGYDHNELLQMNVQMLRSNEFQSSFTQFIQEVKKVGGKRAEMIHQRSDRSQFPVEISVRYFEIEQKGFFLNIIRDISERKLAEKTVVEANNKLQALYEVLPIGVSILNQNREIVFLNSALEKILGISAEDIFKGKYKSRKYFREDGSFMPPEEFASSRVIAGEPYVSGLITGVEKEDGSMVWTEVSAVSTTIPDWNYVIATVDITDKIKAQKELIENLNALKGIIDTSPLAVVTIDLDGKVTLWNRAAESIFGWSAKEVINQPYPLIDQYGEDSLESVIHRVNQSTEASHYEAVRYHKNGKKLYIEVNASALLDYRGNNKGFLAVMSDITVRKEIEEAKNKVIEERNQLLNRLNLQFNRMPIGFILTDKDLNIIDWNPEAEKIFGYSREEMIGKNQYETIIPKDYKEKVKQVIQKTSQGKQTEVTQNENITKDGRRILVEWHNTSLLDESGKLIALMNMAIDVTEKAAVERKILESEEKLRAFFESPLVGISYSNIDGLVYSANNELLNMLGYSIEDLEGGLLQLDKITSPEFLKADQKAIRQAKKEGICTPYEKQFLRKDGKPIWVLVGFVLVGENREMQIGYVQDISERKRDEEELRNKQKLLNLSGSIGKLGGWEFDTTTGEGTWTDEVARIHDLDPAQVTNKEIGLSFYKGESRVKIENAIKDAIEFGKPYDLELELISAKGIHKLIRTVGQPEIEKDKIVRLRGIFQDITELKKAEAEIKKLNEELEQRVKDRTEELLAANKELEAFSYSVSHDLRAPIRAIDGFSQIIVNDFREEMNPDVMRYLEIIRKNTQNMGNLVDDLLAFSRLGRHTLQKQDVDTKKLVSDVVEEIKYGIQDREIDFQIGDLPGCEADWTLLHQVFINLISNSVKFTRKCEHARIEIGYGKCPPCEKMPLEKNIKNCYYVRDNGVGFDLRYYDKLFGVFQRLHRVEDYEGTGVGLAIVKRIIEKHGGVVWADARLNEGATFYFVLGEREKND